MNQSLGEKCHMDFTTHDFRSKTTLALRKEWRRIVLNYGFFKLKPPMISLIEAGSFWGRWQSNLRLIEINERLVREFPWEVVVQILKHEIAHQICCEIFFESAGHGPRFREVCQKLYIEKWAQTAAGEIPSDLKTAYESWLKGAAHSSQDRIIRKAEKLLALAQSSDLNEAKLAMSRVQELYAKYNLSEFEKTSSFDDMIYVTIHHRKKRVSYLENRILSLLMDHYFVDVICFGGFDQERLEEERISEIYGRRENVLLAEYVYHFLNRECVYLLKNELKVQPLTNRKSFQIGLIDGLDETLKKNKAELFVESQLKSLVVTYENQIYKEMRLRHPYIRSNGRSSVTQIDRASYQQGKARGNQIIIHKGIQKTNAGKTKLISA